MEYLTQTITFRYVNGNMVCFQAGTEGRHVPKQKT
jgi:hypothetical protein